MKKFLHRFLSFCHFCFSLLGFSSFLIFYLVSLEDSFSYITFFYQCCCISAFVCCGTCLFEYVFKLGNFFKCKSSGKKSVDNK